MKTLLLSVVAALLLLSAGAAEAQTATPGINSRQRQERARIRQGVRSGELNRAEATRLRAREAEISQDRREARADGIVTTAERHDMRHDERRASRAIYRQKHDAQQRRP